MAELNPNVELLDLTTKKTTQKIIYNILKYEFTYGGHYFAKHKSN